MRLSQTIFAAATVAAFAATSAMAQASGPVRGSGFDAAQLSAPPMPAPSGNVAANGVVRFDAGRAQEALSRPHLYTSVPLSAGMGVAGAVLGYGLGFVLLDCSDEGTTCAHGPDNAEYFTAATGLALGAAVGAHIGGLRRDSKGSLGLTLLGAAAGALPLVFVPKDGELDAASAVSIAAAPLGAVLVDYLVRKPRR